MDDQFSENLEVSINALKQLKENMLMIADDLERMEIRFRRLSAENEKLRAVLEQVEYTYAKNSGEKYCPWCNVHIFGGHTKDCPRQSALYGENWLGEPKNRTYTTFFFIGDDGPEEARFVIHYADYVKYKYLPAAAQCDEVRAEYEAWWAWKRGQNAIP